VAFAWAAAVFARHFEFTTWDQYALILAVSSGVYYYLETPS
jgi:hypothetical protein